MANPKVADILKQASLFLQDANGEKWKPVNMVAYLNAGKGLLFDKHPSAFYVTSIVTSEPDDVTETDELAIAPRYSESLAHYIASQCLMENASDENNAKLSKMHLDLFASLSA
jgi:hypothetical protein